MGVWGGLGGVAGGGGEFAGGELFDEVSDGAFGFDSFGLPGFVGAIDLFFELLDGCLELVDNGAAGAKFEFFFAAGEVLFEVSAVASEFLLSFGEFGGGGFDFVTFGEELQSLAFEVGGDVMSCLFEASACNFGGDGIADECVAGFFDDETLFEDFGLCLVEFGAEASESL